MKFVLIMFLFFGFRNKDNSLDGGMAHEDWELSKSKNGINVYTRQADGAKIKEFKAVVTVTAKMVALETLIETITEYPDWQANIATAKILREVSPTQQYIYYTTDVPWPVKDRDIIVYSKKTVYKENSNLYSNKFSRLHR